MQRLVIAAAVVLGVISTVFQTRSVSALAPQDAIVAQSFQLVDAAGNTLGLMAVTDSGQPFLTLGTEKTGGKITLTGPASGPPRIVVRDASNTMIWVAP